ncbi:hypothetical protein EZJ19_01480 [Parasulfuritortus cantonensis]|uniref:Uncharacterized protein n=1 Tax=Parasulfuritortus cantonensis TaxID=2528202 RepID=A0A4R1BQH4_9PROT|nr:hypothetical protein [Parasulfuritortus cantonensis]TCJ19537.1 hypothetical protein EZJ19_01480 [Parasulfuritortus cantonensis]
MADEQNDIFGKIDAMLGKRAGFGGVARLDEEFPLLTEVVDETPEEPAPDTVLPVPDAMSLPGDTMPQVAAPEMTAGQLSEVDIDRLAAALEARLSELFIRQQLRIEALVRRVVQEELDRRGGPR